MHSITQDMRYRESLLKYAERHGTAKAARKYDQHPSYIYFWRKRWLDGGKDIHALADKSRRPYSHPNHHTDTETTIIRNLVRRNPNIGLVDLWHKLRARGYTRSLSGLYKATRRLGLNVSAQSLPSPTYKPKPYQQMTYPGERIQIDVKYVPRECLDKYAKQALRGGCFYQYTAIDEFSRIRYLSGYDEHNTYTSSQFLKETFMFFFKLDIIIDCVQVDNGLEFTKRLVATDDNNISLFERTARELGITVKHIKPHTPRHNGKVERSHREDQKLFYSPIAKAGPKRKFSSLPEFQRRLKAHMWRTNNRPMRPLGYKTPAEFLRDYKEKRSKKEKAL